MKQQRRTYTREFRREALQLWQSSGKSAGQIQEDLGITHGLLYKWKRDLGAGSISRSPARPAMVRKILRLRWRARAINHSRRIAACERAVP